jgi:phosphoribosylformylglycinamidine cyclo-ligase
MLRVFNCGIGYLAVVPPADIAAALAALHALGREAWHVGTVTAEAGILFER